MRVGIADEVPGRVDEGVHGVRLPARLPAAAGTGGLHPVLRRSQWRASFRQVLLHLGQEHGEIVLRDGHDAALVAVENRDRAAPVALAREQPVAEPVADSRASSPAGLEPLDDRLLGFRAGHAGELR